MAQPGTPEGNVRRRLNFFAVVHGVIAAFFVCASLLLIAIAARTGWSALISGLKEEASQDVIETIGLIAIATVSLQIAQTITEEEVIREAHISAPTRVRRYLSRFLVVVVVALLIEGLISIFKALHGNPEQLNYAANLFFSAGALLAGWGIFIKFNRAAEELEPEAMQEAKSEDKKLE